MTWSGYELHPSYAPRDLLFPVVGIDDDPDARVEVKDDGWERRWRSQDHLFRDPRCPGCGKTHARRRVGKSLSWVVLDPCAYRGPVPR